MGTNPEVWVQLGEGTHNNTDATLLETVKQLRDEMENLREDNEILRLKQESILKSLSDKQNQRNPTPSREDENRNEEHQQRAKYFELENKEGSKNVSGGNGNKTQKTKLLGEIKKIKPLMYDREK